MTDIVTKMASNVVINIVRTGLKFFNNSTKPAKIVIKQNEINENILRKFVAHKIFTLVAYIFYTFMQVSHSVAKNISASNEKTDAQNSDDVDKIKTTFQLELSGVRNIAAINNNAVRIIMKTSRQHYVISNGVISAIN